MPNLIETGKVPVFILAGGFGTRMADETKPKPLQEVGGIPLVLHLMRHYYRFGFNDFVICGGYKSWELKYFFMTNSFRSEHLEIDDREENEFIQTWRSHTAPVKERWRVAVIDTGEQTQTGARLARAFDEYAKENEFEDFAVTYGDGLCNVNLQDEFLFHQEHHKVGTVLGVRPPSRFGELFIFEDAVVHFEEKPISNRFINGGFFFFQSDFRNYVSDEKDCVLEGEPLKKLSRENQLQMYRHEDFWMCMDTPRDQKKLEELFQMRAVPFNSLP